ncbi:MAG: DNA-binding protein [Clostridia bacterium]|nr:DNA-binding protein [Clostridia bacterium]
MEENFYFIELFEKYKDLLTKKQKDIFEMHYSFDLSLSEIAEEKNITRQNVSDAIKSAKEKLVEYENILQIKGKSDKVLGLLEGKINQDLYDKIKDIIGK